MYLEPHLDNLLRLVREKAMIQYCIPYSIIDMTKMAQAFNISVEVLEDDLVALIRKNKISARIDSHKKVRAAVLVGSVLYLLRVLLATLDSLHQKAGKA